jgi:hypothetical protein
MIKRLFLSGMKLLLVMLFVGNAGAGFNSPVGEENTQPAQDGKSVIVRMASSDIVEFPNGKVEAPFGDMKFSLPTLQRLFQACGAKKMAQYHEIRERSQYFNIFAGVSFLLGTGK